MGAVVYTVGHSKHEIEWFIELLTSQGVNCVVDVRSIAASRFNPQYNKKKLGESLKKNGIAYLHMPEEFGARQTSLDVLTNGKVDFEKVRNSSKFKRGVERLKDGVQKGYAIALMCAEAEPLDCHRFSMISYALKDEFEIVHILKDKSSITNHDLEQQLLKKYRKKTRSLNAAYKLQNQAIAYSTNQ